MTALRVLRHQLWDDHGVERGEGSLEVELHEVPGAERVQVVGRVDELPAGEQPLVLGPVLFQPLEGRRMQRGHLGEKVNELIADLKAQGKTVLTISHNLEHVFSVGDRLVVLRHGRRVGIRATERTTREEVVGLITGALPGE